MGREILVTPLALCREASCRALLRIIRKRQSHPRKIRAVAGAKVGAGENPEGKRCLLMSVRKCGEVFSGTDSQEEMFKGYRVESYPSPWRIISASMEKSPLKCSGVWLKTVGKHLVQALT